MARKVRGGEVVVLLQGHGRVEAAGRVVGHEEVSQDEVAVGALVLANALRGICRGVDAAEPRAEARRPHLCQQELRCRHRRQRVALGGGHRGVCLGEVAALHLKLLTQHVLPLGDVIAHLHAGLPLALGIVQRHVPGWRELAPDDCVETEPSVVLTARRIDIPCGPHAHPLELRLHHHDVVRPLRGPRTARGDDAEAEAVRRDNVLSLFGREHVSQEVLIHAGTQVRLHAAHAAAGAVKRRQLPAEGLLYGGPVVEDPALGAHPDDVGASRAGVLHALPPRVRQPADALAVYEDVRRPLGDWEAVLNGSPQALLRRWRLGATTPLQQELPGRGAFDAPWRKLPRRAHGLAVAHARRLGLCTRSLTRRLRTLPLTLGRDIHSVVRLLRLWHRSH
mmetsp:Transcript_10069/g.27444  ORF Transcript_10069/g.27444 Transcript_10069/m.27444 type:complete len:393 (-) Transcript_10069:53-1231(-)